MLCSLHMPYRPGAEADKDPRVLPWQTQQKIFPTLPQLCPGISHTTMQALVGPVATGDPPQKVLLASRECMGGALTLTLGMPGLPGLRYVMPIGHATGTSADNVNGCQCLGVSIPH